jgi:creatinine amidohydrolase
MHGFIPEHRFYAYKTWPEIHDLPDKANVPLILPIGSIEQHGPHLPVAVDSALTLGVIGEALKRLPLANPALCLPPLYYGDDYVVSDDATFIVDGDWRAGTRQRFSQTGND